MGKALKKVQWYEGMLLEPHHFQQQALFFEQLGQQYLSMGTPFFWGVQSLTLDQKSLASGLFRITELSATLPDGSFVAIGEGDDYPQLDLKTYDGDPTKPFYVHLCVVRYKSDAANTSTEFPRYDSIEEGPFVDENTGQTELYIPKLRAKIYLVAGELPPRYISFPLSLIVLKDDGYATADFIPPRIDVLHGSLLSDLCMAVADSLREKVSFLSTKIISPSSSAGSPLLAKYSLFFNMLAPLLPRYESMLNVQMVHPFTIYGELCAMAGQISCLVDGRVPPLFNAYNHNDLINTFRPVLDFINDALEIVKRISIAIPFTLDERTFSLALSPEWVWNQSLVLGVRLAPSMTEVDTVAWINNAVIASSKYTPQVREKRILGAARTIIDEIPEMGLVSTKGIIFVSVLFDNTFIDPSDVLQIINIADTQDKRPSEVVLYVTEAAQKTVTTG